MATVQHGTRVRDAAVARFRFFVEFRPTFRGPAAYVLVACVMSDTPGSAVEDLTVSDLTPAPVSEFPQPPAAPSTVRERWFEIAAAPRFALPLLTILCGAAFIVNLGGYPLYTKGEPREAVVVLDMFKGPRATASAHFCCRCAREWRSPQSHC
jgi:hypothetical protein